MQEPAQLGEPVEADVAGLESPQEDVRDPRARQVGTGIPDHEPPTWSEHPGHLPDGPLGPRVMVEGVRAQERRERAIGERKRLGIPEREPHTAPARRKPDRLPDHLR